MHGVGGVSFTLREQTGINCKNENYASGNHFARLLPLLGLSRFTLQSSITIW